VDNANEEAAAWLVKESKHNPNFTPLIKLVDHDPGRVVIVDNNNPLRHDDPGR
jgi:hypothetical protein